jgi:DNA polymerase-1
MIYFIGNPIDFVGMENSSIEDLRDFLADGGEIGFDTETTGFDPYVDRILSYQFGNNDIQYVVDASQYPIELLEDELNNPELILLIHNAKFDLKFLYHIGIYPHAVWDTYLGEGVLHKGDNTVRKSLEATVNRYLNYFLNKTIRGRIFREKFSERVIKYCAEDVKFLPDVKSTQVARLNMHNLMDSMSLENLFVKVLTYIEYSGIYLDPDLWKSKVVQDNLNFLDSLTTLDNWIIENKFIRYMDTQLDLFDIKNRTLIDWSSPKQVAELFNYLGIDTKVTDEKTGKLKDSVEAGVLEKQKDKSTLIPIYLRYKQCEKILSTYGETVIGKIHPLTGRIHTQFTQIIRTGRMSSGGKLGDKETINLQNIPKLPDFLSREKGKIYERQCFTHQSGNILVNADYSGQEQVIFANWTLDPDLLKFYQDGLGDMHSFIASKIFPYLKDVPLKTIKNEYQKERQIAKSAGFAINYGGDGSTISDNLNISREEGDEIYNAYFRAFPGVSNYFKQATNQALRDGYILFNNISKSKCFINFFDQYKSLESKVNRPGFWEKYREEKTKDSPLFIKELRPLVKRYFKLQGNISRMALNFPIQGSAAEITKLACIYIFEYITNNNLMGIVQFSNVIHDEILLECPQSMANVMAGVVGDCMTRAGRVYCKVVPLKTDVKICEYWDH